MTDYQYQTILKSIKLIVKGCKTVEEVEQQIDYLLGNENGKGKEGE